MSKKKRFVEKIVLTLIILSLYYATALNKKLYAASTNVNYKTVCFDLSGKIDDKNYREKLNKDFQRKLRSTRYLVYIKGNKKVKAKKAAIKYARQSGAKLVIYGTVSTQTRKKKHVLGKEKEKKYLLKESENQWVTISVYLVNVKSKKTMRYVSKKIQKKDYKKAIDSIINRLRPYYKAQKIKHLAVEKQTNNSLDLHYILLANAGYVCPVGALSDFVKGGFGFDTAFLINNFKNKKIFLGVGASYYYMFVENNKFDSYSIGILSLLADYNFFNGHRGKVSGQLGAGFHFNFVNKNNQANNPGFGVYRDPHLFWKLRFEYKLNQAASFFIVPGYTIMFEKENNGSYLSLSIGALCFF